MGGMTDMRMHMPLRSTSLLTTTIWIAPSFGRFSGPGVKFSNMVAFGIVDTLMGFRSVLRTIFSRLGMLSAAAA